LIEAASALLTRHPLIGRAAFWVFVQLAFKRQRASRLRQSIVEGYDHKNNGWPYGQPEKLVKIEIGLRCEVSNKPDEPGSN
jgi:hypothetical protein